MKRYYILPLITVENEIVPAYLSNWAGMTYGSELVMLAKSEVTTSEHNAIIANSDVASFPLNLDGTVGANLTAAINALEFFTIPGEWITSGMTWRQVLKGVGLIFCLASRYAGMFNLERFFTNFSLSSTFQSLPVNVRQRLIDLADNLNLDRSGITGTMTIRQILNLLRPQLRIPIIIGGEQL